MTALREYERLESSGLWRANADAQRRDVIANFGNATLVITDGAGRPLTHWSLAAITRCNPGKLPAVFGPNIDDDETLELDDETMINAIEKVGKSIAKTRPKPGKLRHIMTIGFVAGTAALAIFWLPNALMQQTMAVVPLSKRTEIGAILLGQVQRLTGPRCRNENGIAALETLRTRLLGREAEGQVVVLPQLAQGALALPGGIVLIDRRIIENAQDPAVPAGYIVAAALGRSEIDPLAAVLKSAGIGKTVGLLTTGDLPPESLVDYAREITESEPHFPKDKSLVAAFKLAQIPTGPFAMARDETGQRTKTLIQNDPYAERDEPEILSDGDWVRLQGICNG